MKAEKTRIMLLNFKEESKELRELTTKFIPLNMIWSSIKGAEKELAELERLAGIGKEIEDKEV